MTVRRSAFYGIISAVTVACASPRATHVPDATATSDLALEVENHNWSDVLVYIVHDGVRSRFVEVTATKSATQAIPPTMMSANGVLQFLVHRIGGHDDSVSLTGVNTGANELTRDDYLSPRISVRTGSVITLTLESSLARSTVGVW